jgi:hypothetical protein
VATGVANRKAGWLVQDLSVLVDKEPTYAGNDFGSPDWSVIAVCADAKSLVNARKIEVGIIPTSEMSAVVKAASAAGKFDKNIPCRGLAYHG